ncbi:aldo/keto reductase [Pendulispora brunnea]|uniref:Aldo/keto reductase n=2 Tax=Pendulispora brunnea TaxID=2905690 RepID=A0ABZ2K3I8_9BACT
MHCVVRNGVNVFDLVPYCRNGGAEKALAEALSPSDDAPAVAREEIIVMSRAGFLDEDVGDFGPHTQLIEDRYISRGTFAWEDLAQGNHTIAPAFLRRAIETSVRRLRTGIDVLFVASPAIQLSIVDLPTLEDRLRRAFETLEECVSERIIGRYGVVNPAGLQLARLMELAREVGGNSHHFRAVQFPLSLHATTLGVPREQVVHGHAMNILDAARELGLWVCVSGAIRRGDAEYDMDPEVRGRLGVLVTDAQLALQWARSMPGVGVALCGMRRLAHIEENCAVAAVPLADAESVLAFLPDEAAS